MAENTTELALLLKEVPRALDELRRAQPVVLGLDSDNLLIFPAEFISGGWLAELRRLAGVAPALLLSGVRAQRLGISADMLPRLIALPDHDCDAWLSLTLSAATAPKDLRTQPAEGLHQQALGLLKLAALLPAAAVAALPAMDEARLAKFLHQHNLVYLPAPLVSLYREQLNVRLTMSPPVALPIRACEQAALVAFRAQDSGITHLAIVIGTPQTQEAPLVRAHSSCLTGDLLGSLRCDCGDQLNMALAEIAAAGHGVLLYLNQEGRGVGLMNKLRAYRLQEQGLDTVDANEALGYDADERNFRVAATMLTQLGIDVITLLTNNPAKVEQLERAGIKIAGRRGLKADTHSHNEAYLKTKAARLHHQF